jgi:hypothetical protein
VALIRLIAAGESIVTSMDGSCCDCSRWREGGFAALIKDLAVQFYFFRQNRTKRLDYATHSGWLTFGPYVYILQTLGSMVSAMSPNTVLVLFILMFPLTATFMCPFWS